MNLDRLIHRDVVQIVAEVRGDPYRIQPHEIVREAGLAHPSMFNRILTSPGRHRNLWRDVWLACQRLKARQLVAFQIALTSAQNPG